MTDLTLKQYQKFYLHPRHQYFRKSACWSFWNVRSGTFCFFVSIWTGSEDKKALLRLTAAAYTKIQMQDTWSPQKIYASYRFTYGNHVSFGIAVEKDPWWIIFLKQIKYNYYWYKNSLKEFTTVDFYSFHLYLHNINLLKPCDRPISCFLWDKVYTHGAVLHLEKVLICGA